MKLFGKKTTEKKSYDRENQIPAIRASICTGEQVAGFKNIHSGKFDDIMLLKNDGDLERFKNMYGIEGKIEKFY